MDNKLTKIIEKDANGNVTRTGGFITAEELLEKLEEAMTKGNDVNSPGKVPKSKFKK